jgi:hypothetical protein
MTTATLTSAPLFAGFAELVAGVQRPRRRRGATLAGSRSGDRDRQRLLDDLRALPDAPADVAYRVRV